VPLYEYRCKSCKHRFETIQKFSDDPIRVCPKCGEEAVEQMVSAPAIQFKGSGWYVTDYARKGSAYDSSAKGAADSSPAPSSADSGPASPVPASKPAPSVSAESK